MFVKMYQQLRSHIEKIVPLTDEEFEFVSSLFSAKHYKKHQFLVQQGEMVPFNYYVVSGLTKLVYTADDGKQHILAFAMQDWWDNDFQAYYTQTTATLSLECLEDTVVLCLSLANYRTLCTGLPKIEHFFLEKVTLGFLSAQRRILSLLTASAKERYEQLIKQHPSLLQRVPKTQLAAYLGVSRETLSRLSL
ncbi:Crp/Fnr family transcriptional regulator [Pedobacter sp.]|uniref:Crp/Fnr family transcriptional regulator n=1 Tax=Pedobacter sp. TaxID=1411316 RepID=UPI003D7F84DC